MSTFSVSLYVFLSSFALSILQSTIAHADDNINIEPCSNQEYDEITCPDPSKYNYPLPCPGLKYGYRCDFESPWATRDGEYVFCDIDIVDINDMTYDRFMNEYLFKKPVVINANLTDWSEPNFWSKTNWLKNYGTFPFEAGRSLELVLNAGIGVINITLEEYFKDTMQLNLSHDYLGDDHGPYDDNFLEDLYVFDRSIWREEDKFQLKHFNGPEYFFNSMEDQYGILFIGTSGTGATWHPHGETWAGVAHGRKRWFLYPPEVTPPGGFWPTYSSKDWFLNIYPHLNDTITHINNTYDWNNHFELNSENRIYSTNDENNYQFLRDSIFSRNINNNSDYISLNSDSSISDILSSDYQYSHNGLHRPLECIQSGGQMVYLPEYWWHAVLNVGEGTGAAIQTSHAYVAYNTEISELSFLEKLLKDKQQKLRHQKLRTDLEKDAATYDMLLVHDRMGKYAPYNAVHQFFVGHEYNNLNEYELAEQYYTEAVLMDPSNIEGYVGLARIYRDSTRLYHNYLSEICLRLAYILNHNHPKVRGLLMDTLDDQGLDDLVELVLQHKPLPPLPIYTAEELDKQQEDNEKRSSRYKGSDDNERNYYGFSQKRAPKPFDTKIDKNEEEEGDISEGERYYDIYENREPIEQFDDGTDSTEPEWVYKKDDERHVSKRKGEELKIKTENTE